MAMSKERTHADYDSLWYCRKILFLFEKETNVVLKRFMKPMVIEDKDITLMSQVDFMIIISKIYCLNTLIYD
jgi:hypothetical protein